MIWRIEAEREIETKNWSMRMKNMTLLYELRKVSSMSDENHLNWEKMVHEVGLLAKDVSKGLNVWNLLERDRFRVKSKNFVTTQVDLKILRGESNESFHRKDPNNFQ